MVSHVDRAGGSLALAEHISRCAGSSREAVKALVPAGVWAQRRYWTVRLVAGIHGLREATAGGLGVDRDAVSARLRRIADRD